MVRQHHCAFLTTHAVPPCSCSSQPVTRFHHHAHTTDLKPCNLGVRLGEHLFLQTQSLSTLSLYYNSYEAILDQSVISLRRYLSMTAANEFSEDTSRRVIGTDQTNALEAPEANSIERTVARHDRRPSRSAAATLPTELIQSIYRHLGPFDFDSARHVCHNWFNASLCLQLLSMQLKRGGWWTNAVRHASLLPPPVRTWWLSCYLARECELVSCETVSAFNNDADEGHEPSKPVLTACAVSPCGKYYTSAAGQAVHTYKLGAKKATLLYETFCERNVVALAIDAGPERLVLVVLLEGRLGFCFDLLSTTTAPSAAGSP